MKNVSNHCPTCDHVLNLNYHFCQHCLSAFIDLSLMGPDERAIYFSGLYHWYGIHNSVSLEKDSPIKS